MDPFSLLEKFKLSKIPNWITAYFYLYTLQVTKFWNQAKAESKEEKIAHLSFNFILAVITSVIASKQYDAYETIKSIASNLLVNVPSCIFTLFSTNLLFSKSRYDGKAYIEILYFILIVKLNSYILQRILGSLYTGLEEYTFYFSFNLVGVILFSILFLFSGTIFYKKITTRLAAAISNIFFLNIFTFILISVILPSPNSRKIFTLEYTDPIQYELIKTIDFTSAVNSYPGFKIFFQDIQSGRPEKRFAYVSLDYLKQGNNCDVQKTTLYLSPSSVTDSLYLDSLNRFIDSGERVYKNLKFELNKRWLEPQLELYKHLKNEVEDWDTSAFSRCQYVTLTINDFEIADTVHFYSVTETTRNFVAAYAEQTAQLRKNADFAMLPTKYLNFLFYYNYTDWPDQKSN